MRINSENFGECITKIAAKGRISTGEALALLNEVADRSEKMRRTGQADPHIAAAQELSAKLVERAKADRLDALRNADIRSRALDQVDRAGGVGNAETTLRSLLHGTNQGDRDSIEALWKGNAAGWQAQLDNQLRKAGLRKVAISGALDRDVARELFAINAGAADRVRGDNPARTIAAAVHPLLDLARNRLNDAGARIEDANDYVAHTLHDPAKLRRAAGVGATPDEAFATWWKVTEPKLSQATFENVTPREGETPAMARQRFGRSVFDALVTGVHMTHDGAFGLDDDGFKRAAFEGGSNLARRLSQPRVLRWKDGESWHDYMQEFGTPGTLVHGVMMTLDKSARQLALMEKLGTNPANNLSQIIRKVQERYRSDLDGVKEFQAKIGGLENVMMHLDGRAQIPANEMWARIGSGLRTWETLSSLGGVGVTHFASIWPTVTSEMVHHGVGRLETLGKLAAALAKGRGSAARQDVLADLGAYSDGLVRDMFGRWQAEDTVPGRLSSIASTFMRYTGIRYVFDNTQAAVREMLASHLSRNVAKPFDELEPHLAQILGKYGIGQGEWDLLRGVKNLTNADGRSYFTPRDALRVDPDAAQALLRKRGAIAEDEDAADATKRFVQGLSDKLYAYYGDAASHSVITPGVRERALVLGSERPGSFGGELRRFLAQFRMWPLAAMNQIIGREIHMSLTKREAVWNLGVIAALSASAGYLRMAVNDVASGKPVRSPLDPATLAESLAAGGGLGVLGDFLFGEASRMGGLVNAFGGPVVGDMDQLVKIFADSKQGKDTWPELARFGVRHVPFANLVYLKGALDYLLWYHLYEAASPGWWERTNRRLIRTQGSPMLGYRPGQGVPFMPLGIGTSSDSSQPAERESSASAESAGRRSAQAVPMPSIA